MKRLRIRTPAEIVQFANSTMRYRPRDSLVFVISGTTTQGYETVATMRMDYEPVIATERDAFAYLMQIEQYLGVFRSIKFILPVLYSAEYERLHVAGCATERARREAEQAITRLCDLLGARSYRLGVPAWAGDSTCGHFDDWPAQPLPPLHDIIHNAPISTHVEAFRALPEARTDLSVAIAEMRTNAPCLPGTAITALCTFLAALPYDKQMCDLPEPGELEAAIAAQLTPEVVAGAELMLSTVLRGAVFLRVLETQDPTLHPHALVEVDEEELLLRGSDACLNIYPGSCFLGSQPMLPVWGNFQVSVSVLRVLSAYVETEFLPELLGALAWIEWGWARNSFATHYAHAALGLDPECGIAQYTLGLADAGIAPAWIHAGLANSQSAE